MKKFLTLGIVILSFAIAGCSNSGWTKREQGTAAGALVGGAVGYGVTGGSGVGTAAGAVGGAIVGHELAK